MRFLIFSKEPVQSFLNRYGFSDQIKDDYLYPYYLFNHYLNATQVRSLNSFQNFMVSNRLAMPPCSFNKDQNDNIYEIYNCNTMIELCSVQMYQVFQQNRTVNCCAHCGKWFVPKNKSDEKYCLRPSPRYPDKNCRDAAKLSVKLDSRHKNEAKRLTKNILQMHYNNGEDTAEFNTLNAEKRRLRKAGMITEDEHIDWLKSNYKRKY